MYAAAVILDPAKPSPEGLHDSKLLSREVRRALAIAIRESALGYAVALASVEEIDRMNILRASMLAMRRAVELLDCEPEEVCVDGLHVPSVRFPCRAIVKGDQRVAAIAAASILAKVARDEAMEALDGDYPAYGFALHKGYPTPEHLAALRAHGPCEIHRRSFEPVRALLQADLPF